MKRACGTWFALYLVLAAAVAAIVYRRFPVAEAAAGAGAVGGGVLWLGVGYLWGIRQKMANARMIRRALAGDPPIDGEKIAAIGRIEAAGSPLTSPLGKTQCVAYKYEIVTGYGDDSQTHYDGFALAPSMIQTRQGSIRLLAWPDPKMSFTDVPAQIAVANAEEYIAATQFREPGIMNIRKSLADMMAIYRDDDGTVRMDQMGMQPFGAAKGNQPPVDMTAARYREWVLRPGQGVCVTGRYSVERGGIVPSKEPLLDPVTIELGEPDAFTGRSVVGATGYLIGGAIFIGIVAAALLGLFAFVPLDATEQMAPSFKASWPEIRLEQWVEKKVRVPMRQAGMLNAGETVSITIPEGTAAGRVRSGGIEQSVSKAAMRPGMIDIDDGTVTLSLDEHGQPTALSILRHDVPLADASIQLSGGQGRIAYFSDDRACRVTFNAGESR